MDKLKLRKMIKEAISNEQIDSFRLNLEATETIDVSEFDADGKVRAMVDGSGCISSGIPENDFAFFTLLMLKTLEYRQLFTKDTGDLKFYIGGHITISSEFKLTNITIEYLKCKSNNDKRLNMFRTKLELFREGYSLLEHIPPDTFSKIDFQKEIIESEKTKTKRTSKKFNKIFMQYALNNDFVKKFMTAYYNFENYTQVTSALPDLQYSNIEESYFIYSLNKRLCEGDFKESFEELHDLFISLGFTTSDDYTTASPFTYEHDSGLKFSFYAESSKNTGKNIKLIEIAPEPKPINDPKRAIEVIIEIGKFHDLGI